MSLDLARLRAAVARHGRVARVVVTEAAGSTPREVGASMLVWADGQGYGQTGTIGGGALELNAAQRALSGPFSERIPLGPNLGQCCGGAVTLLCEIFTQSTVNDLENRYIFARPVQDGPMPLAVKRTVSRARNQGHMSGPKMVQGWFIEPIDRARVPLWIYGAGHVGRALVDVITPLDQFVITWVDTSPDRFPDEPKADILPTPHPERAVALAPDDAQHLVLTYSHALDLALCHAILLRSFAGAGLIGSATKWARFRTRLTAMGHSDAQISRIACPIGDPTLGKAPQAIAIGVAGALLREAARNEANRGHKSDRTGHDRRSADA